MVDDPNKTEAGSFVEDEDFLAAESPATDAVPEKRNLKEIWDQNPSVKIFAIVAVIALVIIGFMVFGGGDKSSGDETSAVKSANSVSQPPGTAELPPAYEEAVRQANSQSAKQAEQTGGSSIPTPIARPSERIEAPVQVQDTDPLSEWRKEAENRRIERQQEQDAAATQNVVPPPALPVGTPGQVFNATQGQNQQPVQPPLPSGPTPEQVAAIANQLQQFMTQNIIEPQTPKESNVVSLNLQPGYDMAKYFPNSKNGGSATTGAGNTISSGGSTSSPSPQQAKVKPVISAGSIAYAQIITEANSDVPGPVLAEVASGPLAGGRAIGQFQVAEDHLVVTFSKIVKDDVEYPVQAYALDPNTTLPGMATDINNHYFTRVMLPAASSFIQGFAQAATQTNSSVVVTNGAVVTSNSNELDTRQQVLQGLNTGAQKLSTIVEQESERPITIRISAGTRIGMLFTAAVVDPDSVTPGAPGQQGGYGQAFNASPYGQAYNAYNAYANGANGGTYANSPYGQYGGQQNGAPAGSFAAVQQQQVLNPGLSAGTRYYAPR